MDYPSKSHLRKSGIIFSLFFVFLFSFLPFLFHQELKITPLYISIIVFLISLIFPYKLRIPYIIWIKIGDFLGKVNGKLILTLFFYFLITPFSFLRNFIKTFLKIRTLKRTNSVKIFSVKQNFKDQY